MSYTYTCYHSPILRSASGIEQLAQLRTWQRPHPAQPKPLAVSAALRRRKSSTASLGHLSGPQSEAKTKAQWRQLQSSS